MLTAYSLVVKYDLDDVSRHPLFQTFCGMAGCIMFYSTEILAIGDQGDFGYDLDLQCCSFEATTVVD